MRLQTEYMSFKNHWMISSSYDFQAHLKRSQRRYFSQTALLRLEVLPELSPALQELSLALPCLSPALPGLSLAFPGAPRLVVSAPWFVAGAPSSSEGRQECPPRVGYSPEIDASMFTLHILPDTPGGFQWLKYILLMLWMSKRHTVTLHHVIAVYNDMFDHLDSVMPALAMKKTPWKEDLFFAVKFAQQTAIQILYCSDSNDWYASHFGVHSWFFPEAAIV